MTEMYVTSFCGETCRYICVYIYLTSTYIYYRFLPRSFAGVATCGGDFVGYSQAHRQARCSFLLYSPFHALPELQSPLQGSGNFSLSNIYQLNILDGIILTTNNLCCSCFVLCYSLNPVAPRMCAHPYTQACYGIFC